MLTRNLFKFSAVFVALFIFASCSEQEFYEKEEYVYGPDEVADIVDEIALNCESAAQESRIKTHTIAVSFPSAIECDFNESGITVNDLNASGNGPRENLKIRARIEQSFTATLPANSTVCDMDFNFPLQTMQYDDEVLLLMNNNVVMSSQNYSENMPEHSGIGFKVNDLGFMEYKWMGTNGLYDLSYYHNLTPKYCLGLDQSTPDYDNKCFIPVTETLGQLKLDIPKNEIIKIGVTSRNYSNPSAPTEIDFGFVTTGDNDDGDCEHSAYSFNVDVKYID